MPAMADRKLVKAINSGSVSPEELVSRDGWRLICQVRGRHPAAVDERAWQALCARRGACSVAGIREGFD